jgi:phosphate starvation-inducible PhoH-like protein
VNANTVDLSTHHVSADTPVLGRAGWVLPGELGRADVALSVDGSRTRLQDVAVEEAAPLYSIGLSDGARVEVGAQQQWTVQTHNDREASKAGGRERWRRLTTLELKRLIDGGARRSTYLRMIQPIDFRSATVLPLEPYALGLLLGDGSFRGGTPTFSKPEPELHAALADLLPDGVQTSVRTVDRGTVSLPSTTGKNPLTAALRDLGLWGHGSWSKFVPESYLRAEPRLRLAVLQGLLDTDGWVQVSSRGHTAAYYSTSSGELADDVVELVESLGGTTTLQHRPQPRYQGGIGRPHWVVRVRLTRGTEPFRLARKLEAWKAGQTSRATHPVRRIETIEYSRVGRVAHLTLERPSAIVLTRYIAL